MLSFIYFDIWEQPVVHKAFYWLLGFMKRGYDFRMSYFFLAFIHHDVKQESKGVLNEQ